MKKTAVFLIILLLAAGLTASRAGSKLPAKEGHMSRKSGILFLNTQKLEEMKDYYMKRVGCTMWMDQGDCVILRHGNFLFGFCTRDKTDTCGLLTFFYDKRGEVDRMYGEFKDTALSPPKENPKYPIYHFFAKDPEGRLVEFQYFTCPIDWDF